MTECNNCGAKFEDLKALDAHRAEVKARNPGPEDPHIVTTSAMITIPKRDMFEMPLESLRSLCEVRALLAVDTLLAMARKVRGIE
jgi:hypothetical protein